MWGRFAIAPRRIASQHPRHLRISRPPRHRAIRSRSPPLSAPAPSPAVRAFHSLPLRVSTALSSGRRPSWLLERTAKMNDNDVSKQVQQMVQFIRQEAEEKANEISVSAEEEFNIEKLQIVEAEKKKIRQEFERKEKQVEVRRKIEYSTQLNASRLKLLQAQDDLVRKMKDAAEKQLQKVGSVDNDDYSKLLEALIIQGLLRLKEPSTQLRCREQDLEVIQSVIKSAKQAYAEQLNVDVPEVFVDDKHFLPGPPESSNHGSSCTGGVVLATKDGRIVLENTLDARLEVVFKQQLPEIRKRLFPAGGQAGA